MVLELLCAALAVYAFIGTASIGGTRPLDLIQGADGRLSSSKFQFFLWTATVMAAFGALVAAWASNCHCAFSASKFPTLPNNVLLAMGFSVATATTANGITASYVSSGRVAKGLGEPRWQLADLVADDSGRPDLSKVQMLAWTFIAVATYAYSAYSALGTFGISATDFPDIPSSLMVLMGIGQGAYLGTKLVSSTSVIVSSISPASTSPDKPVEIAGSGFGSQAGTVVFGTVAARPDGDSWTDKLVTVKVPAGPSPGTKVGVQVLLPGQAMSATPVQGVSFTYS